MQMIVMRTVNAPILHRDGSVTYWDPLHMQWIKHVRDVPEYALIVLPSDLSDKVQRHLEWRRLCG